MKITFVSNYINHHQIPFCNAMCEETDGQFTFIQTRPMEEERIRMGWQDENSEEYIHYFYKEEALCKSLINESDVVLFGGCDDESYIEERLKCGKPVVRISERLYKTGQWKAVSPRGLLKKYHDHTRYRNQSVYLLCAGAYVPSDFHIVRAYPQKMFCWGYFPETKQYDVDKLLQGKGYPCEEHSSGKDSHGKSSYGKSSHGNRKIPYLLWAGRFIDWKHPELALQTARYLKDRGLDFHMDMVGGGALEDKIKEELRALQLEDCVTLVGYQKPEEVRKRMEQADIYLFTSDRQEGWGAVANEAMNSGCAVVANHMLGAAPYLIKQGYNGCLYQDGRETMLYEAAERLVKNPDLCKELGRHAYETIIGTWNARTAAHNLMELIETVVLTGGRAERKPAALDNLYPCAPAPVIAERHMWRECDAE